MIFFAYINLSTVFSSFMHKVIRPFNILIAIVLVSACSQHQSAPISSRQPPAVTNTSTHIVRPSETLYSIAWQYSLDYRYLASLNGINTDYIIYPGQRLRLKPPANTVARPRPPIAVTKKSQAPVKSTPQAKVIKPIVKKTPPVNTKRSDKTSSTSAQTSSKSDSAAAPTWRWPTKGKVLTNFYTGSAAGKGIDINGQKGESISAAAAGVVVYAGNGIRGYGNLVIIRHNANYLSAYAHNDKINVREGEQVKGGQRIAELGSTGSGARNRSMLHFQVRKGGKPIDPIKVLPKRNF